MSAVIYPPFTRFLAKPFYLLLLLYFCTLSADVLHIKLLLFKGKLSILVGVMLFAIFFARFRVLRLDKDFLIAAFACSCSMLLSMTKGYHWIACTTFLCFYLLNYLVFFVLPVNLFCVFKSDFLLKLYFSSFVIVGIYAAAQVLISVFGVYLPFANQRIMSLARGQGFSYEPSYYALYITPYAIFQTTKFFLQKKEAKKLKSMLGANFLLLVSTSTGCFFSYLALFTSVGLLKLTRIVRRIPLSKILFRGLLGSGLIFFLLWLINPLLISKGFLKFFYVGSGYHGSLQGRLDGIARFWSVFLDHPLIGAGLGGVTTYCAQKEGNDFSMLSSDLLNYNCAMNITTEILASLGIVGAVAMAIFLFALWRICQATLRYPLTEEERINAVAFIVSLCVMFFTLQFNSSIMRAYTWVHVGISVGYMKSLRAKYLLQ